MKSAIIVAALLVCALASKFFENIILNHPSYNIFDLLRDHYDLLLLYYSN